MGLTSYISSTKMKFDSFWNIFYYMIKYKRIKCSYKDSYDINSKIKRS